MDSHSWDNQWLHSPDGTAIIIKFTESYDLADYIVQVYMTTFNILVQYEVQFLKVNVGHLNKQ